jgi:hypothetical protein
LNIVHGFCNTNPYKPAPLTNNNGQWRSSTPTYLRVKN